MSRCFILRCVARHLGCDQTKPHAPRQRLLELTCRVASSVVCSQLSIYSTTHWTCVLWGSVWVRRVKPLRLDTTWVMARLVLFYNYPVGTCVHARSEHVCMLVFVYSLVPRALGGCTCVCGVTMCLGAAYVSTRTRWLKF